MRKIYILGAFVLISGITFSQGKNAQRKDQIEAQRSAYITSRIGLSSENSRDFWPMYDKMRDELDANRDFYLRLIKPRIPLDQRTDAEVKDAIEAKFKMEEEKLRIERKYHGEFLKVLSLRQVAKLYQAEEEFKKEVLKELRRR